jgi:CRP/FNR family transcriptional regulator, cyclic AMP receptor protein
MKRLTLIDKAFLLKKTPLFGSLDLDLLLPIAEKLTLIDYDAGENIFTLGDDAQRMYFIYKGTVDITEKQGQVLATLHDNDFFGDESIFSEKTRAYNAISRTDTDIFTLSKTNLLTIISECPSVAVGLLQVYASITPFRARIKMEQNT